MQLDISLDDAEVDDRDDANIEGIDSDEDDDSNADKDDSDKDANEDGEDRSEAIHELPTLNLLSNIHPISSPFWL